MIAAIAFPSTCADQILRSDYDLILRSRSVAFVDPNRYRDDVERESGYSKARASLGARAKGASLGFTENSGRLEVFIKCASTKRSAEAQRPCERTPSP